MIRRDALQNETTGTSEFTASVLIIHDDADVRTLYGRQLEGAGTPRTHGYAAVLLDVDIPEHLRDVLPHASPSTTSTVQGPLVVMNGRLLVRVTIEAVTVEPPPRLAVTAGPRRLRALDEYPHSMAHRWASYVLSICRAPHDIKTLDDWARLVATSHTTLRQICRMVGVQPHDARNLGRALFAITHAARELCPPTVLLDVADTRTLRTFLRKAGPHFRPAPDMDAVHQFLDTQVFVEPMNQGLRILRELLNADLGSTRV